ncbi:hypothetical protein [Roseivivax isoporae]|uniref:DUF1127 domain-containing protein n=1 Tax=Roseivivax isoporae LMG 25204 TaxID=1449351 RepID=X7FBR5_9RHOB|nr:hypothetical protein [Roseivivax isoporae]ETX30173.1 hypothetical protein RISW2_18470 [Roseivivax isoporae LMG 25204]
MAQSANSTIAPSTGVFSQVAEGFTRGLTFLIENNPRYARIEKINRMSDAELEAQGVTRAEVVRRVFRDRFYL